MKSHPILFTPAMVRALLAGTKTQTRRLHAPRWVAGDRLWVRETWGWYGRDRGQGIEGGFWYKSDLKTLPFTNDPEGQMRWSAFVEADSKGYLNKWRPSIFMPRWASRITLEVVRTWSEPLQDISEADAIAEGILSRYMAPLVYGGPETLYYFETPDRHAEGCSHFARQAYFSLWDSINGHGSAAANPLVYPTEFKVEVGNG